MKDFLLILMLVFLGSNAATAISLNEAIKAKKVNVIITGNKTEKNPTKSSHTGKCLKVILTSTSNLAEDISIDNANHFANNSEQKQDLISTEQYFVKLNPNETKTIVLNALCGEKSNASPSENDTFKLAYRHSNSIEKLTMLLQKLKTYDNTAQQAMWCFTDNNAIDNIYDTDIDTTLENELVKFVAKEKNIAIPKRKNANTAKRIIRYPLELFGKHSEHVDGNSTIGFYLTDTANKVIETIYPDDTENRVGTVKYSWAYRGQLAKGTYYFQMKKMGFG